MRVALLILLFAVAEAARVVTRLVQARVVVAEAVRVVRVVPTEATARQTQVAVVADVVVTEHRQAGKAEAEL